jgi:hypothetical protein
MRLDTRAIQDIPELEANPGFFDSQGYSLGRLSCIIISDLLQLWRNGSGYYMRCSQLQVYAFDTLVDWLALIDAL